MRIAHHALSLCCLFLASVPCEAGEFFRRVPEVGEWARYEIVLENTSQLGKPLETSRVTPGTLVVKCVGEESIDDRRHLWIESCYEMKIETDMEFNSIHKLLVPEDELLHGTPIEIAVRGWQSHMKREPVEMTFSADDLSEDTGGATTARMSSRTIVFHDEEIELTYSETTPLPTREDESGIFSGEMTIWPHDELAFGVASMDVVSRQIHVEDRTVEVLNEYRYDLVATGTDAVSELPDHN